MTEVQLTAAITHEGDWWVARCLQVEVTSQGETVESALAKLREALELYFEDEPLPADIHCPLSHQSRSPSGRPECQSVY
jgi:predicted RNase H-like HicB family nuclease